MRPVTTTRHRHRQAGASLVELMIALVLGLLVTAAIYQVFLSNQHTQRMQQALSHIQENGRFALDMISRDIRHAGYHGGCGAAYDHVENSEAPATAEAVSDWQRDASASPLTGHIEGSDVLRLHHAADSQGADVESVSQGNSLRLADVGQLTIVAGDIVTLSNGVQCDTFEIRHVTPSGNLIACIRGGGCGGSGGNSGGSGGNSGGNSGGGNSDNSGGNSGGGGGNSGGLRGDYSQGGMLYPEPDTIHYYIGQDVDGIPGLRRYAVGGSNETLISGAESLRIRYGVGRGRVESYVEAADVDDWSRVLAVRLSLLLRAEEANVMPEPVTLQMGNISFAAESGDRRMYQVFTTTVGLRNRLP